MYHKISHLFSLPPPPPSQPIQPVLRHHRHSHRQPMHEGRLQPNSVSHRGIFEIGFFSPGQSKNRYISIWYHSLLTQAIVWAANRDNPVTEYSGMLCLVAGGDLRLIDHTNTAIWSTNMRMKSNLVIAMLTDSSNLVLSLQQNNGFYQQFTLWESFNYPSDNHRNRPALDFMEE
ncbi:hypothetical protein IEQ34_017008 [Dendrobium chrysotoxum]|uniref:Bulb-type lectin domain-containing protein n=1 Tax=Dendrobium chrysotoxum TaxID=161865 RepID=A0AAV7FZT8_DENCH|nr:hypothetical protein IEQ34_017008 [Dendrobium chrysotoxum]